MRANNQPLRYYGAVARLYRAACIGTGAYNGPYTQFAPNRQPTPTHLHRCAIRAAAPRYWVAYWGYRNAGNAPLARWCIRQWGACHRALPSLGARIGTYGRPKHYTPPGAAHG